MLAVSIVRLKHLPVLLAVVFFLISGFIDGLVRYHTLFREISA